MTDRFPGAATLERARKLAAKVGASIEWDGAELELITDPGRCTDAYTHFRIIEVDPIDGEAPTLAAGARAMIETLRHVTDCPSDCERCADERPETIGDALAQAQPEREAGSLATSEAIAQARASQIA